MVTNDCMSNLAQDRSQNIEKFNSEFSAQENSAKEFMLENTSSGCF